MKLLYKIFIIYSFLGLIFCNAFASEPILITSSKNMNDIIFDGKWTFLEEWKASTETVISYDDGTRIHLRSAHQGNFLYFFIDVINDMNLDRGIDNAMICIDGNNNKSVRPDLNDYCFSVSAGKDHPMTYQGDGFIGTNGYFSVVPNHDKLIAIGDRSDQNDRYSKINHVSYEFRIPIEIFGRSDNYGLFVNVYDSHIKKFYTWPENIEIKNVFDIPSPAKWGDVFSPDKSLPEFPQPVVFLLFLSILPLIKFKHKLFR